MINEFHYRKEINGLRALAILPVIYYHAGLPGAPGGFVGVDIFFVISGYLISILLFRQISEENFRFDSFFARRIGRIFPNLFFMILITIPMAYLFMPSEQIKNFGISILGASTFTSNIVFALQSNYFASQDIRPLLHTWSLGVEEQFYLLIPFLLFLSFKISRKKTLWVWLITSLSVVSFVSIFWFSDRFPQWTYYSLNTRMWELGVGSLAGLFVFKQQDLLIRVNQRLKETLGWLGIIGLASSFLLIRENSNYPGPETLLPVISTAIIVLFATESTSVGKILGIKPLVGIGLISYSLYLWHQPLIVIGGVVQSKYFEEMPSLLYTVALISLIVFLSLFSFYFIENPLRRKSHLTPPRKVIKTGIVSSLIISILGLLLMFSQGNFLVNNPEKGYSSTTLELSNVPETNFSDCSKFNSVQGEISCDEFGEGNEKIVIWGDSHAGVLSHSIPEGFLSSRKYKLIVISTNGCPPISGIRRADKLGNSPNCDNVSELTSQMKYINRLKPKTVILVSRWSMYLNGWQRLNKQLDETHFMTDTSSDENNARTSIAAIKTHTIMTINELNAENVFFVSQAPDLQSISEEQRNKLNLVDSAIINLWHKHEDELIELIANNTRAIIINTREAFCEERFCKIKIDENTPLYIDDNHLTQFGAAIIWSKIIEKNIG